FGRKTPDAIVFNATGLGYGVFPVYPGDAQLLTNYSDPVMRASARINLYENMLDGKAVSPEKLLTYDLSRLASEPEELNVGILLGQISSIYWHFLTPAQRTHAAVDTLLWNDMRADPNPARNKLLFLAYAGLAQSQRALDTVYSVWKNQRPPLNVRLSEDDYQNLAAGLALRGYPGSAAILAEQGRRIKNPDRQARWRYLQPSLSASQAV